MRHLAIAPRQALKIDEIERAATDGPTVPSVLAATVELPAETTSSSRQVRLRRPCTGPPLLAPATAEGAARAAAHQPYRRQEDRGARGAPELLGSAAARAASANPGCRRAGASVRLGGKAGAPLSLPPLFSEETAMRVLRSLMAWWMTASGWVLAAEKNDDFPLPGGNAAEARALTAQMLAAGDGDVVAWRAACETLRALVEPESPLGEKLSAALADSAAGSDAYRAVLTEVGRALEFVPLAEAPLPEGFPTYTPVGVIEAKQYPARRLAKAEGFWTLFRHITTNDIAMTAPVQMEYEADDRGRVQQRSMAFYYGSGNLGAPGKQGSVSVIDDQPQWVTAVGVRGFSTRNSIAAAKAQLEAWLARHPEYEADGMLRVMGYNSPMVRGDRQFHEVQLPIRKRTSSS